MLSRGYLLSEADELLSRQNAKAMRCIAAMIEGEETDRPLDMMTAEDLSSLFFSFAAASDAVLSRAAFIDLGAGRVDRDASL